MIKTTRTVRLMSVALLSLPIAAVAASPASQSTTAQGEEQMIKSALSAAPPGVAKEAKVVAMDAQGAMRTLREGNNGFTCMPDEPSTPGPDPMCVDQASMGFLHALMTHAAPPSGHVGLMYMLAGGTDASNTDPYSKKPSAADHWIKTGPHLMIAGADAAFYDAYPKLPDPDTSRPYVMWAGTPYQHLMVPVK